VVVLVVCIDSVRVGNPHHPALPRPALPYNRLLGPQPHL